jgi:hypothetical protein
MRPTVPHVLVALAMLGCGASARGERVGTVPDTRASVPICAFRGAWGRGELRTEALGEPFLAVSGAETSAVLHRSEGILRFRAEVESNGWHLVGRVDVADDPLRSRETIVLADGVIASIGAPLRVLDAREGEVLVSVGGWPARPESGLRFTTPIERWMPCDSLVFAARPRGEVAEAEDRLAIGLPADLPVREIAAQHALTVSATPDGAPFLEIGPRVLTLTALLAAQDGDRSRVVIHDWSGLMIVGWAPSSALSLPPEGLLGTMELPPPLEVPGEACVSSERLEVLAARGSAPIETVGWLEAGAHFVRGPVRVDGLSVIGPAPGAAIHPASPDVVWLARASGERSCGATPSRAR